MQIVVLDRLTHARCRWKLIVGREERGVDCPPLHHRVYVALGVRIVAACKEPQGTHRQEQINRGGRGDWNPAATAGYLELFLEWCWFNDWGDVRGQAGEFRPNTLS